MSGEYRHRIVVLCGQSLMHKNTCATLIKHGLNVVGICEADQRTAGLPLKYLAKSVKRKGLAVTLSRIAARALYQLLNRRRDREILAQLLDEQSIDETLRKWHGQIHHTHSYSAPETLKWLQEMEADIFVVHTPYWVGKKVRSLPKTKIVLGGHPGITPYYRGSHSAFWAIYKGKPEDVGCTVFLLDEGVDTGDIVAQDHIPIAKGDSFFSLGWKGMIRIAEMQADILREFDRGIAIPRRPALPVADSEFDNPKLAQYLHYRRRQQLAR